MHSQTPRTTRCAVCGEPLPLGTPSLVCPECAFGGALALKADGAGDVERQPTGIGDRLSPPGSSEPTVAVRSFGDYELLEEIGHGAMGVIYKARQRSLNRIVAVKLMRPGTWAEPAFVRRFRTEAEAIAQLQHPGIVAIHEVGEHEGQPYFSMDYVQGRTLAELVRERPLPAKQAAAYVKAMAEAVHYAHQRGVIHRDLKPSNVLIDQSDQPRITDFGLAKRFDAAGGQSELTVTGQVLGSPNYLPPEQCGGTVVGGRRELKVEEPAVSASASSFTFPLKPPSTPCTVGPWSDVYGLGAILYHVLTGRPPFQAESLTTLLRQVIETEPVALRLLNASIPRDLETICLRCLEKDPPCRYQSAQRLAEELGRFLKGRPIQARPVGTAGKAWKWCRRRPALAGMSGALGLTFILGLAGVLGQWHRAKANELFARQNAYAADMHLAQLALADNNRALAVSLLEKHRPASAARSTLNHEPSTDLRGWEWRYLWQLSQGDELFRLHRYPDSIGAVAVSKDGRLLAVQTAGDKAALWDLPAQRLVTEIPDTGLKALAFSPDDRLLAVANRNARGEPTVDLWDVQAQKVGSALDRTAPVRSVAFSPDGELLATFDDMGRVEVVEWRSNVVLTSFITSKPRRSEAGVVTFSPDGKRLAVGEDFGPIQVVRWPSRSVLAIQTETSDGVTALAFSPDSRILAAGYAYSSGTIRLWDADSGEPCGQLTNHSGWVTALAFSPDGQRLASASTDQTIRIWSVADRAELSRLQGHQHEVWALTFGPDDRTLISGGKDGWVYVWDSTAERRAAGRTNLVISPDSVAHTMPVVNRFGIAFTPDKRSFITTDRDGRLGIWDARSLRLAESLYALGTNHWGVGLSPDGRWLAAGDGGEVHVWDWRTRRRVASLDVPFAWCGFLRFSRTGHFLSARLLFDSETAKVKVWRTAAWEEVPLTPPQLAGIMSVDLSPDDRRLATGHADGSVKLWSFAAGQREVTFSRHKGSVVGVLFSGNGRLLASTSTDGTVKLWDLVARGELATLPGHIGSAWGVAFSSDGRRLATGGGDTMGEQARDAVKLWDLATHRQLLTLSGMGQFFFDVAFSPDGNTLAATSLSGIANFWRAPSWAEIAAVENATAQLSP